MDWSAVFTFLQQQGIKLLEGLLVLAIGFLIVKWLLKLTLNKITFKKMDPNVSGFLRALIRLILYLLVTLTAVGVMGIPMTSVIALVASAGVAVSLAVQGALSNFVGGMTLLVLKPVQVGDFVKIGDFEGTVQSVGTFYTEFTTFDNRRIFMPNSSLTNTAIINYTRQGTRRLDVDYSVSYKSDMDQVLQVLNGLIARNPDVLSDPAPAVHLTKFGDNGLQFSVRVWCRSADYWNIYFYLMEDGKRALDQAGVEIPYPQMDVHIKES